MSLWTPQSANSGSSEITSTIDLYDSDILAIERGPLAWARDQYGKSMNIDQFAKDLTEQFAHIGLGVEIQVWTTQQADAWAFKGVINKRFTQFDPDRQVHEVVSNILDIPGQEGWINTGQAMMDAERERRDRGRNH